MLKVQFYTLLLLPAVILAVQYQDCGSKAGKVLKVDIPQCTTGGRCILKKNTNVTVQIDFSSLEADTDVKAVVHGVLGGVPIPFRFKQSNACKFGGIHCPLNKGATYNYKATLPVLKLYPAVTVDVKWELINEREEDIVCVLIPARIVDGTKSRKNIIY